MHSATSQPASFGDGTPFAAAGRCLRPSSRASRGYPEISLDICVDAARKIFVGEPIDAGIHLGDCVDDDMICRADRRQLRSARSLRRTILRRNRSLSVPDDLRQHNCHSPIAGPAAELGCLGGSRGQTAD